MRFDLIPSILPNFQQPLLTVLIGIYCVFGFLKIHCKKWIFQNEPLNILSNSVLDRRDISSTEINIALLLTNLVDVTVIRHVRYTS